MSDTTPPAVSDAMREAVALTREDIENRIACLFNRQPHMSGRQINRLHGGQRRDVEDLASDIASEIARLTGERDAANTTCDMAAMSGGFYAKHAETYLARAEAAEAETARLRAAFRVNLLRYAPEITHADIDAMLGITEPRAALSSQEQADV